MEYGAKFLVDNIHINYGGGAMNVAVGLNNFGIKTAPYISIGKDQVGREIFEYLRSKKISPSLIHTTSNHKTGFSIIITAEKDREHTIFSFKGASDYLRVSGLSQFRTDWFYVASLTNKEWEVDFERIGRQSKRGTKIAWNPGSMQLKEYLQMKRLMKFVDLLILNKSEARNLVSKIKKLKACKKVDDPKYLLHELQGLGAKKVVITEGSKGVKAIDEKQKFYYYPAKSIKKRVVDTVGAGDSFASGLMAGLVRWDDFDKALQLGLKNSASVLYQVGAQNGLLEIKL